MDTNSLAYYDAQQIITAVEALALVGVVFFLAYYFFIRRPIAGKKASTIVVILAVLWGLAHVGTFYVNLHQYLQYRKQMEQAQNTKY